MSDIYDDLDGEVSASEVIKYWKNMYRKMASLNDELYTRIEALKEKVTSLQLIEKHLLQCCKDHKSRIKELEARIDKALKHLPERPGMAMGFLLKDDDVQIKEQEDAKIKKP